MTPRTFKRFAARAAFLLLLGVMLFYLVFPFYWAINTSLQPRENLFAVDYLPIPPSFEYYHQVFENRTFARCLLNSLVVAGGTTLLALLIGTPAACAIGRWRFRGARPVLAAALAMTMFPQIAVLGALFRMLQATGLYNTLAGLILTYLIFALPFTVWVLTGFFKALPGELEEAAMVDGASPMMTFLLVLLPLALPGIATTGLLTFIAAWNEYLFALTFTIDERARTVPVAIAQFSGESLHEIPWGPIMAASVLVTLPLVVLTLVFQRSLVAGLTAGAVKG